MISRIRSFNTDPISRESYAQYYDMWGGSFIIHPDVLQFFQEAFDVEACYRGYFKQGRCVGAVATWGQFLAGDRSALDAYKLADQVDFGYPVIHLPIAPKHKCLVLYKARFLLGLQQRQVAGALFTRLKQMSILRPIPEGLPMGKKELQIKERRFARLGGTLRDVQEFSSDEIVAMYAELFRIRWGRKPHAIDSMKRTVDSLKRFLFGKILWIEGRPIAIQINFRADTSCTICVDYINGGVDKSYNNISPGSLLSYINGRDACEDGRRSGKLLVYSYGKANTDYKDQWCDRVSRGFSGYLIP